MSFNSLLIINSIMNNNKLYTNIQLTTLVVLRLLIGWHLLYEGLAKLLTPGWSSIGFLRESQWIMSGFANWVTSNSGVLNVIDFINIWGLIAIGTGLIVGLCTRTEAISGALLLIMYYFNNAPIIGIEYSVASEGNYLIVNKNTYRSSRSFCALSFPYRFFHLVGCFS